MRNILLLLAFGAASFDWFAVAKSNKKLEKFVKPLTMVMLIAWALVSAAEFGFLNNHMLIWGVVGLSFCLIGDIFLFLPPEQWFLKGLVAFLLGHIGYIISFGVTNFSTDRFIPGAVLAIIIIIVGIFVVRRLLSGVKQAGKERMSGPIVVYSVVISYMLFSAGFKFLTPSWAFSESLLLAGGALLFYISDILNAYERFVSKFRNDRLIIMMTYHFGQFGIVTGVVMHLSNVAGK